jgi:hypothetical protein
MVLLILYDFVPSLTKNGCVRSVMVTVTDDFFSIIGNVSIKQFR